MSRIRRTPALWLAACTVALCLIPGRGPGQEPQTELRQIRELLNDIKSRMATNQTETLLSINKLLLDVASLKEEQARLRRELDELKNRPAAPAGPSTSLYGGAAPGAATYPAPVTAASPSNARVRLVNTYFTDMTAVVNGMTYILPPGAQQVVPVNPGTMTYQVFRVADVPVARVLRPGEELTLTLFPRF
jgi:hypothetical protein